MKEKIRIVQTLWDDIAKDQSLEGLPESHKRILDDRLQKIGSDKGIFKSWSEIQNKYEQSLLVR